MVFVKDGDDIPPQVMAEVAGAVLPFHAMAQANGAGSNQSTWGRRKAS
jgi:hypothetical protein